jgi:hypothetical protein
LPPPSPQEQRPRDRPEEVLRTFCNSLQVFDYQAAYSHLSRDARGQVGPRGFARIAIDSNVASCAPERAVETAGNLQVWDLTLMDPAGHPRPVPVRVVRDGSNWRLAPDILDRLREGLRRLPEDEP